MCKTEKYFFYYYNEIRQHIHKKTKQGYGVRSYFRLMLNKLKVMGGPTSIYTPLGT
jgi:hypothetical protein